MRYIRLIVQFVRASLQQEIAYRANFFINILNTLLNFVTGLLGLVVLFGQVEAVNGWSFAATLALLGVYLTLGALRRLFIGPSLDSLAGMEGDIWTGTFDFTLLRPVDVQFLVSFRQWQPLALLDLALGLGTLGVAAARLGAALTLAQLASFVIALAAGVTILYAILLAFAGLVVWSPGFLFTWVFDALFQMARYPVGIYPAWLRLALTWVVPVGVMTTIPARAFSGDLPGTTLLGAVVFAGAAFCGATVFFRAGLRRYASASS
jgi:ABC-2 type transport system permease protein